MDTQVLDKVAIGKFGGHDVFFIPSLDYVTCKNQSAPLSSLTTCMKNDIDRQVVPNSSNDLILEKKPNGVLTLGCLNDTVVNFRNLHRRIKEIKKQRSE